MNAAKPLGTMDATIIPVGLGDDVRRKELENMTPDVGNVIKEPKSIGHKDLGDKIMGNAVKGRLYN